MNPLEGNLPKIIDKYFSNWNQTIITLASLTLAVSILVYIVYKLYEKIFAKTEISGLNKENIELNKLLNEKLIRLTELIYEQE